MSVLDEPSTATGSAVEKEKFSLNMLISTSRDWVEFGGKFNWNELMAA